MAPRENGADLVTNNVMENKMSGSISASSDSTMQQIMQESEAMEDQNLQKQEQMSEISNAQTFANDFAQTMESNAKSAFTKD